MKEFIFINKRNPIIEIKIKADDYIQALVWLSTVTKYYVEDYQLQPDTANAGGYSGRNEADAVAISEAKELWQANKKLDACKRLTSEGWGIKAAHDYCSENFG